MRNYAIKDAVSFSGKLVSAMNRMLASVAVNELMEFETENYPQNCQLTPNLINGFKKEISDFEGELLSVDISIPISHS